MWRQGDILVRQVDSIPDNAQPQKGRVILAHGEATGHCHEIKGRSAKLLQSGASLFLKLARSKPLEHQEHGAIDLPAGNHEVIRQMEYSPQAIRNVAD